MPQGERKILRLDHLKVSSVVLSYEGGTQKFQTFPPLLTNHKTEVRFARFLSDGFTNMAVIYPPERKLAKRTSVH